MIVLAHIGHWYSALAFIVPALLVVAWVRFQGRRGASHRQEFDELWTLHLIEGEWVLTSTRPTPPSGRRRRQTKIVQTPSPWSDEASDELRGSPGAGGELARRPG